MKPAHLLLVLLPELLVPAVASAQTTAPYSVCAITLNRFRAATDPNAAGGEPITGGVQVNRDAGAPQVVKFVSQRANSPSVSGLLANAYTGVTVTSQGLSLAFGGITVAAAEFPINQAADTWFFAPLKLVGQGLNNYKIEPSGVMCRLPWKTEVDIHNVECSATLDDSDKSQLILKRLNAKSDNGIVDVATAKTTGHIGTWGIARSNRQAKMLVNGFQLTTWTIKSDGSASVDFQLQSNSAAADDSGIKGTMKCAKSNPT